MLAAFEAFCKDPGELLCIILKKFGGFRRPNRGLGPSQGVQGGTEEAPGMQQGGTRDALAGFDR